MEEMVNCEKEKIIILGGGVAGLAASYFLRKAGIEPIVFESQNEPGGLSRSFCIDGFWFDYGAHASFTKDSEVRKLLESDIEIQTGVSSAINYYKGIWVKNPVQINMFALPVEEKVKIIKDLVNKTDAGVYENYRDWLIAKYGEYFAENFPCKYTRKYWTTDAVNLGTQWIGPRMYVPDLEEVLYGAFKASSKLVHYSGEIRYPIEGGFGTFIKKFICSSNVKCNWTVKKVNILEKYVEFDESKRVYYDYLISTLPIDQAGKLFEPVPKEVINASQNLYHTSMVLVSLGIKGTLELPETFYVYDEEIMITRGYSTSKYGYKSSPLNSNTLQLEVYYSKFRPLTMSLEQMKQRVIDECEAMGIIKRENVIISKVEKVEYANVIFTHDIYHNRDTVHNYMIKNNIYYTGRFADWDYMWVDQTIISAQNVAMKLIERIKENG